MRNKILNFFNTKKSIVSGVLFGCLVVTTLFIQNISTDLKQLFILKDGLGTCFSRVGQSFTSKLTNLGNQYQASEFMSNTEECIGDVIEMAENNLGVIFGANIKRLNSLSSDLHWFHRGLEGRGEAGLINNPEELVTKNMISRFEKLEQNKDKIIAVNSQISSGLESSLLLGQIAFYLLILFLPLFMIWDYLERREKKRNNEDIDKQAHEVLLDGATSKRLEVERLLKRALDQNDLKYCSRLFSNYQSYYESYITEHKVVEGVVPKQKVIFASDKNLNEKINEIWNDELIQENESDLVAVSMLKVLTNVVEQFSSTLQGHGVVLDINVQADSNVYAEEESLEQVLYHVLNDSINACARRSGTSKISITSNVLGGSFMIELIHNGSSFDEQLLNAESGLVPAAIQEYLGVGLQIASAFMKEFDGSIDFENIMDQKGELVGAKQRLVFHLAKDKVVSSEGANLIDLKIGKKSEILKQINA